eukprot:983863-Amphidinium_carterae.1
MLCMRRFADPSDCSYLHSAQVPSATVLYSLQQHQHDTIVWGGAQCTWTEWKAGHRANILNSIPQQGHK